MTKTTTTLLLATMMAFSGYAAAQTNDVKSGTQGGAGPTGASGMGDNGASVKSRAEVKSEIMPQKSGIQGGEAASPALNPNTTKKSGNAGMSDTTRAAVKADAMPQKSGIQGGEGASAATNPNTMHKGMSKKTSAQRKAARDHRRAERKAARMSRSDASMGADSSASGAVGNTTVQGGGMGSTGRTLGQGQPGQKQGNSAN
jgi:hypothetical protein